MDPSYSLGDFRQGVCPDELVKEPKLCDSVKGLIEKPGFDQAGGRMRYGKMVSVVDDRCI
jgi:hypothetical protein